MTSTGVDQDQAADRPAIRQVVVGTELQPRRAVGEIGVDEAGHFQLGDEGVDPVHPQERVAAADQLLLV